MRQDALSIAIDGPAGAGKSTVARRVAEALGYTFVDTGAMYRAVAWAVRDREIDAQNAQDVTRLAERLEIQLTPDGRVLADGHDITTEIRSPAISNLTSPLSAIPGVRDRMSTLQKEMGARGGVVMEGRDIGTVVLPHAEVKVFLTASSSSRARRRHEELLGRGIVNSLADLERDIRERDARDASRDTAPMFAAPDAMTINTETLSAEEVVARILELYREAQRRVSV
jgi:cytidylate kinase